MKSIKSDKALPKILSKNTPKTLPDNVFFETLNNAYRTAKAVRPEKDDHELVDYYKTMVLMAINKESEPIEATLMTQACTLDHLFNDLVQYAKQGENVEVNKMFLDMALKAQKQSRQTLTSLADIIRPREPTFVRQQNNAVNQQINNHADIAPEKKSANELLREKAANETMDTRRTFKTVLTDSDLETVETLNGSKDKQR